MKNSILILGAICLATGCFGCSPNTLSNNPAPATAVTTPLPSGTPTVSYLIPYTGAGRRYDLENEFSGLSSEVEQIQVKAQFLRDNIDVIIAHSGDLDEAESDSDELVTSTQHALDRVQELKSEAEQSGNEEITQKCSQLESSLDSLLASTSDLHDNIETAQSDRKYRHSEGISDIADNMDDVETHVSESADDASDVSQSIE